MLAEIAEILISEPGKLKKIVLLLIKGVLNAILASYIYGKVFGPYHLMDLDSWPQWSEFILSGRILICILLFFACHFILFYFFSGFLDLLISWWFKPDPDKELDMDDGQIIIKILKVGQLLDVHPKGSQVKLMARSDDLYDLAKFCRDKDGKRQINSWGHSLLSEMLHVYVFTVLFYLCRLISVRRSPVFTVTLIAGFLAILIVYWIITLLIEMLYKIAPVLINLIDTARSAQRVEETCEEKGLHLHTGKTNKISYKHFHFNDKSTALIIMNEPSGILPGVIEGALRFSDEQKKNLWLITNKKISQQAAILINENIDRLKVIVYDNDEDLKNKIREAVDAEFAEWERQKLAKQTGLK